MKLKDMTTIAGLALAAGFVALTLGTGTAQASEKESSSKNGQLHLMKACAGTYGGKSGDYCTITASDLSAITIGSTISYDQAAGVPKGLIDSNVVLDAGSGNRAMGRCTLDLATGIGLCTFSQGTGRFSDFQARLDVTCGADHNCRLDGTFKLDSKEDR